MSGQPHDPFAELAQLSVPEPDAEIRRATIAASREAFARARTPQPKASWSDRMRAFLHSPRQWVAPLGVTAFGMVAAVAILPDFLAPVPDLIEPTMSEMAAPAAPAAPAASAPMADAPAIAVQQETVPVEALKRRAPGASLSLAPAPSMAIAPSSGSALTVFVGDGVEIGTRVEAATVKIYRIDDGVETLLDTRSIGAGVISVVAAVQIVPSDNGADVVAIETADRSGSRWDAYVDGTHSAELSAVIADATTAAEVERRLEGQP